MHKRAHRRAFPGYVAAGLVATGCHYAVTVAGVEAAGAPPLLATTAGFAVGAAVKYVLNYFVAFGSGGRHTGTIARFVLYLALLMAMNAAIFALLHQALGLHYMAAQVLTTGLLVLPGYAFSRAWVFR